MRRTGFRQTPAPTASDGAEGAGLGHDRDVTGLAELAAPRERALAVVVAAVLVAAMSAFVIAPAPSYDPLMWLLWGREVAGLELSTREGPAFKPLPVAVCALLSLLGGAAPTAWVIVARAGALLALWFAFQAGRELAGALVGALAALAVAFCGGFLGYAAAGAETGWTIALGLAALAAWREDRPRAALGFGVACALLRVEAWPFLLVAGALLWRRRPQDRVLLAVCAVVVPAMWLVPEWLGSGDVLRSGERARVPNPGQPATEAVPAWAALQEAATLLLWPLWAGVVAAAATARLRPLVVVGAAWILLVAVMAQGGFSGEPRYSLPGGALLAIAGAAGLTGLLRERRALWLPLAFVFFALSLGPKVDRLDDLRREQAWQWSLAQDLERVIDGRRDALLACGRPYVGRLRGPLLAYHLDVEKRRVAFGAVPPGVVFRSKLHPDSLVEPDATGFAPARTVGRWQLWIRCP